MRFTPAQIATIRKLRGSKAPWPLIAQRLKATILECRTAIGLQTYGTPELQVMPWDVVQRTLFDSK